jgi:FkbM family methyltransferase
MSRKNKNSMHRPWGLWSYILRKLPRNKTVAKLCRAYLSHFRSDNNVWADTNGEFKLLSEIAPSLNTVLDVGANHGDWSFTLLESNANTQVHCFEPADDNFNILREKFIHFKNVHLNNLVVSDIDSEIEFIINGKLSPMNSIFLSLNDENSKVEKKRSISLDNYFRINNISHVNFVKIDVEGAEMIVLKGMVKSISEGMIDMIQFEYGPFSIYAKTLLKEFFEFFQEFGFNLFKISSKELLLLDEYNPLLENFSHSNWIAIKKDIDLKSNKVTYSKMSNII